MKILYGTGNHGKFNAMKKCLKDLDIDLLSLEDIDFDIPVVDENGSDPLENAIIKAKAYYEAFRIPVFSCDSGLYFENLPEFSPGIHVRNVNGKRLSDAEMTEYYSMLAKKYGDIIAQYHNAICFVYDKNHIYSECTEDMFGEKFILTSVPHEKRVKGFPLDCISKSISCGMYYYDLQLKDNQNDYPGFVRFFEKALNDIKSLYH